jgi:hypothetical protein
LQCAILGGITGDCLVATDCVDKGHFLKNGFVIKIIFYLKQLVKNLSIGKIGLKPPKTDFFNRIGRYHRFWPSRNG